MTNARAGIPRVLLLLPTTTYRTEDFVAAANRLNVDVTIASEEPSTLAQLNPAGLLTLDFSNPQTAARQAIAFSLKYPVDAVIPVDNQVVVVAAAISEALRLPSNSIASAEAAQNKHRMRELFAQVGVRSPRFQLCWFGNDAKRLARDVRFPCVVKPLSLSASQGVIRADDESDFVDAVQRLDRIVSREKNVAPKSDVAGEDVEKFLVEDFVGGPEFAIDGILTRGKLRVLAMFDKPDPLDGPYFEETIYVTPSRLAQSQQTAIVECTQKAAAAIGLSHGPIHAEVRWTDDGPCIIEVNPRSIGGLCSRTLRFGTGMSLEELIIRHAIDANFDLPERDDRAAGVMMIPIPRAGVLREVCGLSEAAAVACIEQIKIAAHAGQELTPLPEGAQYLGFIFARGSSPAVVEAALRDAHARIEFAIDAPATSMRRSSANVSCRH